MLRARLAIEAAFAFISAVCTSRWGRSVGVMLDVKLSVGLGEKLICVLYVPPAGAGVRV